MKLDRAQLIVDNVHKDFAQGLAVLHVLNGVNVVFEQGSTYAITGLSGSGKSTLLHILAGLDEPTSGFVTFNHTQLRDFTKVERMQFLNKHVGLVFQNPYLIKELSVAENVMLKGMIAGIAPKDCADKAHDLLKAVGLESKAASHPSSLSGGQQQRVALARALFNEPAFLLADEPTGNLDERTGRELIDFVLECQSKWHMGVIVSSHDPYVAEKMAVQLQLIDGVLVAK